MIRVGQHVKWDSGPRRWGGALREYRGVVAAIVPKKASAWSTLGDTPRASRKCTDVVRGFDRALVEVLEAGARVFYAPDLRRLVVA